MLHRERLPAVPVACQEDAPSTGKARETPGSFQHSKSPADVSVHTRGTCFPCSASTFRPRIYSQHCGTWDSLVGKPREKVLREATNSLTDVTGSLTLRLPRGRKAHVHAPTSSRGLTSLGRLQKYPKIHVSTGEESSGSGFDSTQGLRPRHRPERNPEWPPKTLQCDWPFLRPPERVPDVPVVTREHVPQVEKIQEVLPSRRDEAHFR